MSCKTCRFVHGYTDPMNIGRSVYLCRRYPPTPVPMVQTVRTPEGPGQAVQLQSYFPPVDPTNTCGEYKEAAPAPANA